MKTTNTDRTVGVLAAMRYLQDKPETKDTITILQEPWKIPQRTLKDLCRQRLILPPLDVVKP